MKQGFSTIFFVWTLRILRFFAHEPIKCAFDLPQIDTAGVVKMGPKFSYLQDPLDIRLRNPALKKIKRKVFAPIFLQVIVRCVFLNLNNGRAPTHQLSDEKITTTWLVPISFTHSHTHTHTVSASSCVCCDDI